MTEILGEEDGTFKFHQIAFVCASLNKQRQLINSYMGLGFKHWVYDNCTQTGPNPGDQDLHLTLAYNYDIIPGFEFELLYYHPHPRWRSAINIGVSHMGYHVDNVGMELYRLGRMGIKPLYRFVTLSHTNPRIKGERRFKEAMFYTAPELGFNIKAIQRIPHDSKETW